MRTTRLARSCAVLAILTGLPCSGQTAFTNFGQVQVKSSGSPVAVQFTFSGLAAQPAFSLQYGLDFGLGTPSCNGNWTACTVNVTFSPRFAGLRQDQIVARNSTGSVAATALLRGTGLGPQLALVPGIFQSLPKVQGPWSIAVDPRGNIFTDSINGYSFTVVEIAAGTGAVTTVAGNGNGDDSYTGDGGPATSATLASLGGIALDGVGNLYIVDAGHFVIRRVDAATQIITTVAGNGTSGSTGDGGPATSAELNNLFAIALDLSGNLFIGEGNTSIGMGGRVRKVDAATGLISTVAGNGSVGYSGDGGPATAAALSAVSGLAVDSSGNLYIADGPTNVIRRVDASTGIITTVAGVSTGPYFGWGYSGDGGPAVNAKLYGPSSLVFDSNENLYISDSGNSVIRKIDASTQIISTVAGSRANVDAPFLYNYPANSAMLPGPSGLAIDSTGTLYIQTYLDGLLKITAGTSMLIFPQTATGSTSSSQDVTVVNIGNEPLTFSSIAVSGPFLLQSAGADTCSTSTPLTANGSCQLTVAFAPITTTDFGALTLSDNSSNQTTQQQIVLTGPFATVIPNPATVDFGTVYSSSGGFAVLDLLNNGNANLNIAGITIIGPDAGDFSFTYTFCTPTVPQYNCGVNLYFTPTGLGQRNATLVVTDNAADSPQSIPLTGLSVPPPKLTANANPIVFAPQALFSPTTQTITLANTGGGPLYIGFPTIDSGTFYLSDYGCQGATLQPAATCTLSIVFNPITGGVFSGTLSVPVNYDTRNYVPYRVPITGAAIGTFSDIAGSLQHISIGASGGVWGLNSAGEIYSYQANQSWSWAPGWLTQISVGSPTAVWGLNGDGEIYRRDTIAGVWDWTPGTLAHIAVGADGDTWGLNGEQSIYHYNAAGKYWEWIAGELAQIAVGFDDAVWGLNAAGVPYRYNPASGGFEQIPGTFTSIAVGADGDVWALNGTQVSHFNPLSQNWEAVSGTLASLSVGGNGNVFGLDASENIFEFYPGSQTFFNLPGSLIQIAAAQNGDVWGVNAAGGVYEYRQPLQTTSAFHAVPANLSAIAVAADGSAWGVDANGAAYTFNPLTQAWIKVPGTFTQIAVAPKGVVWALNGANQIFRYNNAGQTWESIPGALTLIALGANGDVWGINAQSQTYHYDATQQSWINIPGALTQMSVGVDGAVWGINQQQQIYRFDASSQSWQNIPGSLKQIAVGSSGEVWGVNQSSRIYHYNAARSSWDEIPGILDQISVGFDGTVMGLFEGIPYRLDPASQSLVLLGGSLQQLIVGSDSAIWAIDSSGLAYRYF